MNFSRYYREAFDPNIIFKEYIINCPCLLHETSSAFFKISKCLDIEGLDISNAFAISLAVKFFHRSKRNIFLLTSLAIAS